MIPFLPFEPTVPNLCQSGGFVRGCPHIPPGVQRTNGHTARPLHSLTSLPVPAAPAKAFPAGRASWPTCVAGRAASRAGVCHAKSCEGSHSVSVCVLQFGVCLFRGAGKLRHHGQCKDDEQCGYCAVSNVISFPLSIYEDR